MNRYDYVGSFLRPERLKKARRDFENNTINAEELKKVEDECITEKTVAKQTIPSPGQFYAYFTGVQLRRNTLSIYENEEAFAKDVVKAYV